MAPGCSEVVCLLGLQPAAGLPPRVVAHAGHPADGGGAADGVEGGSDLDADGHKDIGFFLGDDTGDDRANPWDALAKKDDIGDDTGDDIGVIVGMR